MFFWKMKHHNVVTHVPNFQLSTWSSSFFCAFFLHLYGTVFYWTPDIGNDGSSGSFDDGADDDDNGDVDDDDDAQDGDDEKTAVFLH